MNNLKAILICIYMIAVTAAMHAEHTFAMIKPYAVKRGVTDEIINIIKKAGFAIIAIKKTMLTPPNVYQLYSHRIHKPWFMAYVKAMTTSPVIMMILEKDNAVEDWDKLKMAIRKIYATTCKRNNIVHGSDTLQDADREIALLFNEFNLADSKS